MNALVAVADALQTVVVVWVSVIAIQTAVIVWLFIRSHRLKRQVAAIRNDRDRLLSSYQVIRLLGGELAERQGV